MTVAKQSARRFLLLLLAATTVVMIWVVRPIATALFLATVLAVVLWPLYTRMKARLGGRAKLAASLLVLGVVTLLVSPAVALSAFVVQEGTAGLEYVSQMARSEGVQELVARLPGPVEEWVSAMLARVPAPGDEPSESAPETDAPASGSAPPSGTMAAVSVAARATGSFVVGVAMMLVGLYFMFLHGDELVAWIDDLLPLQRGQTLELLTEFKNVSRAVVLSGIATAAIQAVAAGIGYLIAALPHPLFFAAVTFFLALVPVIGAAAVCLAAAVLVYATGRPYMALFLAAWGLVVVGLVDNLVKPLLAKRGMKMSGAIVFFALIGGLKAFGMKGLLIGPIVVALFLALLRMYRREKRAAAPS